MLVTITLDSPVGSEINAMDLSHLLRKHPEKVQSFDLPVGTAHVFYPHRTEDRTTAALLLQIDPINLVRSKRFRGDSGILDYYVNDRPYTASSLTAVAIGKVFRSAMTGVSVSRPELASTALPLTISIPVISTRDARGIDLVRRLFAPLGWNIEQDPIALDSDFPQWGDSQYSSLVLRGTERLDVALRQLYVLLPVLDDSKHYWVNDDETQKLARQGQGWLEEHPERELITRRYLVHQQPLVALAEAQYSASGQSADTQEPAGSDDNATADVPLRVQRAQSVLKVLKDRGAQRVVDMGCGSGALLRRLQADPFFTRIVGTDVSARSLELAANTLHLDERSDAQQERITLLHSSAVYQDERLNGFDAIILMEVIEHLDLSRLPALEAAVFAANAPRSVVVTTPNAEYNDHYPGLEQGALRHDDHRFEWTRDQFQTWAHKAALEHSYVVSFEDIGPAATSVGAPTQMAIFYKEQA
ncbi:3' terminal RNA ribose 2'-O-methyltransferase Hen1 [Glutamicibacter sp.]|uniref:3' terminal RNA ribose 2'-O-methyltransferase Hen1 n=1 Tax=Glutamicibacter sp. TaxID=1931995 RepID=UPI0028BE08B6|nr:3' terminal RNA ribose 2'-O-methyltransferase Hen1 [Glutamicibacter sp.]